MISFRIPLKPSVSFGIQSGEFPYLPRSTGVHHEVELAAALKSGATVVPVTDALDDVFEYALLLDMIRRDLQGDLSQMIWKVPKIISFLSEHFELKQEMPYLQVQQLALVRSLQAIS